MSNVMPLIHRVHARNHRLLQERLEKQRLACPCGGTKDQERMIVCLECFRSAPLAMQRDVYSRVPSIARTAARQLLSRAASKKAERQLNPGGELTRRSDAEIQAGASSGTACHIAPAPAGVTSHR